MRSQDTFGRWLAAHDLIPDRYRPVLLRRTGVTVSDDVSILSGLRVLGDAGLVIGNGTFVNHDCLVDAAAPVTIGEGAWVLARSPALDPDLA